MGKMYESLKDVVQEKLPWNRPNAIVAGEPAQPRAVRLSEALKALEKVIAERIVNLAAAAENDERLFEQESRHAEDIIAGLHENLATIEAKLKETDNIIHAKDSARQSLEQSLTAKIQDLQSDLRKKEEALESKDKQVEDLQKHAKELESAVEQAKSEAERSANFTATSSAKIAAMETQLKQNEQTIREKESAVNSLQQQLAAKANELQSQVGNKDKLLESQTAEIKDLKSQLQYLARGIDEMSSFFAQAKAYTGAEKKEPLAIPAEPVKSEQQKSPEVAKTPTVTPPVSNPAKDNVSAELFSRVTDRLTRAIGPVAPAVIRDQVKALGESMEKFPKSRLIELIDGVSNEIPNKELRFGFRKWFAQQSLN